MSDAQLKAFENLLGQVQQKDLLEMTRVEALDSFIARAKRNIEQMEELEVDVQYAESRFPGEFTTMLDGIRSDLSTMKKQLPQPMRQKQAEPE